MADRCTLHWNHLDAFKAWLVERAWEIQPTPAGNGYEVLRARHPQHKEPVIYYSRGSKTQPKQHLTSYGLGSDLVRQFLRDRDRNG